MEKQLISPTGKEIVLRSVLANAGVEAAYRKRLLLMVEEMQRSLVYFITTQWRANTPMAQDAGGEAFRDGSPANAMRRAMHRLSRRWLKNFGKGAEDLAKYFVDKAVGATDTQLQGILRKAGFTVKFQTTETVNNAMQAAIGENVSLINSIAQQHLADVEGVVMRSFQRGRDLGEMTEELMRRYDVTRKRAAFISRDQSNKLTAVVNRTRQQELGITQARWRHSGAGKHPRLSHLKAGQANGGKGDLYDVDKGCLIDGEYILPGELPNCRCSSRSVIPGFSK